MVRSKKHTGRTRTLAHKKRARARTRRRRGRTRTRTQTRTRTRTQTRKRAPPDPYTATDLYPVISPLTRRRVEVGDGHSLYVETYGCPAGKPVLYVHGGPGAGINPHMARFFNPRKYFIVLVDQRGSGKSAPAGSLVKNTTAHLIADFEKVRRLLKIDRWMVYGGSWGSTLSLAYAIRHPDRTTELVVRGVYFCSDRENHWISEPHGAQRFNPAAWKFYKDSLPKGYAPDKKTFMSEYSRCFKTKNAADRDKCLLAWSVWEDSLSTLNPAPLSEVINSVKQSRYQQTSVIENTYFKNNCFLPSGFFSDPKNLRKLKKIPVTIVQGMYDLITPYTTAYSLHKSLPHSKFFPTLAGHSAMDPENIKYLVKATDGYATK